MYRPQFPYRPIPSNCEACRCLYSFDGSNTPGLLGNIAANAIVPKIPLGLDQDADFFLRAIQISPTTLAVGLDDCGGHAIVKPTSPGLAPLLAAALWGQCDGGPIITLDSDEWGIYCPSGGVLELYLQNPTAAPVAAPIVTLHGIKRFTEVKCR